LLVLFGGPYRGGIFFRGVTLSPGRAGSPGWASEKRFDGDYLGTKDTSSPQNSWQVMESCKENIRYFQGLQEHMKSRKKLCIALQNRGSRVRILSPLPDEKPAAVRVAGFVNLLHIFDKECFGDYLGTIGRKSYKKM
jgi:hypothetical protein